ncbi:sensor histidine kinase [Sulfuriflexus mobilis]|uniref:sensor histidine kinase n=1 Tax=Sulfuriflexus mobilis TaxID=1811807 RepID=UPI000F839F93|nr:ATP-binding protein [Sulfuriflexus mobilis]
MSAPRQQQDPVYAEQLRLLFSGMPLSVAAISINSALMLAVLWAVIAHEKLVLWGLAMLLVVLYRGALAGWYANNNDALSVQRWGQLFTSGALLTACVWASAAIFLFPDESITHQAFLAFIFAGMSAGAVTTLSYLRLPATLHVLLMLTPLAAQFFRDGEGMAFAMGAMIVVYMFIIVSSTRRFFENARQNIELRFAAADREKTLKETQNKYENIFHSAPLGVAHFDKNGVIIDCNETFCRLARHERKQLIGSGILAETMDEDFRGFITNTLAGESNQYETHAGVIGGDENVAIRAFFRGMEQNDEVVVIIEDVTDEKRIERLKDEFVSTVSHELRTPLTSIHGAVSLITGGAAGEISEEVSSLANIAVSNTHRLLSIIDDILDIGKIDSGNIVLEMMPVSVSGLLAENIEDNRHYGTESGIDFALSDGEQEICINADPVRLSQVLSNLLSNAAKFSPSGSVVDIDLSNNDGRARIAVTDHGPGIPKDFHATIFDRFTQSDATNARIKGGTGLGLSISKALVEQMGGEIGFDTRLGEGTTFYIEFPCIECASSAN